MSERGTILIVDDEVLNIEILANLLQSDHELIFATDGAYALELARKAKPDLILLDVMMPGMDGYEVKKRLARNEATAGIPVIFVTGQDDNDAEIRGLEAGAVDYVTKPLNPLVLRIRVRNHLELKRSRDALARLAMTDGLTGLANRRRFDGVLAAECARLRRSRSLLSLILIDIDHFKTFNDRFGHLAGDECLRQIGALLAKMVNRASDLAARYGGEELACILPDTDHTGAMRIGARIHAAIAELDVPRIGARAAEHVTASLGVGTLACGPGVAPEDIIGLADTCLYRAKDGGRNRVIGTERR